jgi:exopolysaccharide biosynthesis protein
LMIGGAASQTKSNENRASRRTAIGMDAHGRIVIISTPLLGMGLYDLSQYLATTDLQLINVVNLDGGGSTMLMNVPFNYQILSLDPVPIVLAAYKK